LLIIGLFILDYMMSGGGQGAEEALKQLGGVDWTAQFLHGYSFGQMFYMFVAMIAGAGAIANDNRSNALLVYLSKPCTKQDYIIGKWVGVFVPVAFSMLLPALFLYLFGVLNYREYGFVSDDPWLILRLLAVVAFGAAFHASMVLGVSSMFNQGRMASATYVGIYFITNIVTVFVGAILEGGHRAGSAMRGFAESIYYCSIDGLNIGVAKIFFDQDSPGLFMNGGRGFAVDRPSPLLAFGGMILLGAIALRLVYKRVRAVEVVS
jgi:ABC-2 type transport system permease protein